MTRSEATDLLYLIRRLWHSPNAVTPDDITASMIVLFDVDFQAAAQAVTRMGDRKTDWPPSIVAIVAEVNRGPALVPPYHRDIPPEALEVGTVENEVDVRALLREARDELHRGVVSE